MYVSNYTAYKYMHKSWSFLKKKLNHRLAEFVTPFARTVKSNYLFRSQVKPVVSENDRACLYNLYLPEIESLSQLLKKDLSHWK